MKKIEDLRPFYPKSSHLYNLPPCLVPWWGGYEVAGRHGQFFWKGSRDGTIGCVVRLVEN